MTADSPSEQDAAVAALSPTLPRIPLMDWAVPILETRRRMISMLCDMLSWAVALLLANLLRFDLNTQRSVTYKLLLVIGIAITVQLVVGWKPLYRVRWKIGSFEEIAVLSSTLAITTGVVLLASLLAFRKYVPIGTVLAAGPFALVFAGGFRTVWRLIREYQKLALGAKKVIVFGAGDGGRQVVDALVSSPHPAMYPVALLDDHPTKRNAQIRHLRVGGGRDQIELTTKRHAASVLIIAIPSATPDLIREISSRSSRAGLEVFVLPPVSQLFTSALNLSDIRPLTETELLGRRAIDTDVEEISEYLTGRRVLVTGAGGSIGSELCRQIHRFGPSELVMLDRDESGLHQVELSIEGKALLRSRSLAVCDIRDIDGLRAVFDEHRPSVVFHAAALKHLPLLEMWPSEAVKTNIFGTLNTLKVSAEYGVKKFVNISTDKAALPSSVLGFTKRIGERITAAMGRETEGDFISVRFGNVLGSRGSFLGIFRQQIDADLPLTVTHPDVTRFFMTVHEAVQLTIQAGALGRNGNVLILDMGEPVRIVDVAQKLIDESGKLLTIEFTGLRQGEKLHEQLFDPHDTDISLVHPLISSARVPSISTDAVADLLSLRADELRASLESTSLIQVDQAETGQFVVPQSRLH